MALVDIGNVKNLFNPNLDASSDVALQQCIDAACAWVEAQTGRKYEKASYTRNFDGRHAEGPARDILTMDPAHRPVLHTGADLVTVTEDGEALTVAKGYDTDADVIVVNADIDLPARLWRQAGPWSPGVQNIAVSYKAGVTTVPSEIEHLAAEVAWKFYSQPTILNRASQAKGGASAAFIRELSPMSQAILAQSRII